MLELNGKITLITGANRGIGLATAKRFLAAGARVIATVRSDAAATEASAALGEGPQVTIERCEIADEASVDALAARVKAQFGHVDVLVNNAGVFVSRDRAMQADTLDLAVLRETLATNLFGTIAMCRAFVPLIPRGGRIINVSSTMGQLAGGGLEPYATAYGVSKAALNAYTTSLANAVRDREILVDAMHPGWVKTDMGGPNARIGVEESTETPYFLATRPAGKTGLFWDRSDLTDW